MIPVVPAEAMNPEAVNPEAVNPEFDDESNVEEDAPTGDSSVVRALRAEIKKLQAVIRAIPGREEVETEVRLEMRRESDAVNLLRAKGHPDAMARLALSDLKDSEIDETSIDGWLGSLGYSGDGPGNQPSAASVVAEQQRAEQRTALQDMTSLAARVSSAASATPGGLTARINSTGSQDELNKLMIEAGGV